MIFPLYLLCFVQYDKMCNMSKWIVPFALVPVLLLVLFCVLPQFYTQKDLPTCFRFDITVH